MSATRKGARMGRPPMGPGKAKAAMLPVRLTEEELAAVKAAAERAGAKSVSAWVRQVLLSAAGDP